MSFDLFVQSCIVLKRMTDVFKRYDEDRDGYITLSFEEFLTGMFVEFSNIRLLGSKISYIHVLKVSTNTCDRNTTTALKVSVSLHDG